MKKINIFFWKTVAILWDIRPRMHLPKYADFPIASTDINVHGYSYPEGIKVLYEWEEKGRHWIVFSR